MESANVKCPHFGEETAERPACQKCGPNARPRNSLEIHYKDFRGSEMLDIRMPSSVPLLGKRGNTAPAPRIDDGERKGSSKNRSVCLVLVGLVILFSAIAWYSVLRFLLRP